MSGLEDLLRRAAALESEIARLGQEGAAARILLWRICRETAEVRSLLHSHAQVLAALRETQLQQGRMLGAHGMVHPEQGDHGRILRQIEDGVDSLHERQAEILDRLTELSR